ncbi:hypothetical protein [Fictibacillus halophilus]|uniref:hypothetical protein n=1 Tax=Fictibacillus halophilus TaxID=1610490 RepID=UPI001CFC1CB7|nr:hypothetical protein [Fictibacillus halophilus]
MKRRTKIIIASLIGSILIAAGYVKYGLIWNYFYYKQEFEDVLEYKYDKPVIIKNMSFEMLYNEYHAYAYFEENPEVVFHVGQTGKNKQIEDAFEYVLFRIRVSSDIKSVVDRLLPDNKHARAELMDETKKEIEVVIWHDKGVSIETKKKLIKAITDQGYEVKNMTITNEYQER